MKINKVLNNNGVYNYCWIYNNSKCSIGGAQVQMVMDENIKLCDYITQSFTFCIFVRSAFLLKLFHTLRRK